MTASLSAKIYILLFLLVFGLSACQKESRPLINIGGRAISLNDFRMEIQPLQTELVLLPAEQQKLLLRQALSQLIDQELLLTEAQRRGIVIFEQELQQEIDELRGNYSHTEYMEILGNSGQDPERWMHQLRIKLLNTKVAAQVTRDKVSIDAKQVEEYYLQHFEAYRRPDQLQARQILLANEEDAIQLRTRLLAGEPFEKLARQYSLSPDSTNGGDLGLFAKGQFPPEFDKTLFSLTPGRVSQPVKSPYGIHLFLVDKRHKAGVLPLAEVETEIRHKLQAAEEAELYQQWLQGLREGTQVQIDWEQLDKLHFNKAE